MTLCRQRPPSKRCNASAPPFNGCRHTSPTRITASTTSTPLWEPAPPHQSLRHRVPLLGGAPCNPAREGGPAPTAKEPQAEPARAAAEAPDPAGGCMRQVSTIRKQQWGEPLPVVLEVLGWLQWATSWNKSNCTFDHVFLGRDGGNQDAPPGGWMAREDHGWTLHNIIHAG